MARVTNAYLKELKTKMHAAAAAYCTAYNEGEVDDDQLSMLKTAATDSVKAYNAELERATYKLWARAGDPILIALTTYRIPGAQKLQLKTSNRGRVMTASFSENEKYPIDLPMMATVLGNNKFSDPEWGTSADAILRVIMNRVNLNHTGNECFDYPVSEAAKALQLPPDIDLTTEEGCGKALQLTFDSICFVPSEEDPTKNSIAVTWAEKKSGNEVVKYALEWERIYRGIADVINKPGGMKYRNTGRFDSLIADAMHCALIGQDNFAEVE